MKISKAKLRQIIKEELAEAEETALNSPREAGRQWAYKNLADAVDAALGSGLSNDEIQEVIVQAFDRRSLRGEKDVPRNTFTIEKDKE